MNNLKSTVFAVAAGLAITAAVASAQALRADVPFGFETASGRALPAGEYSIARSGDIWNLRGQESAVVTSAVHTASKTGDQSKLIFLCHSKHCVLTDIVAGYGTSGIHFNTPKRYRNNVEDARVVAVPLTAKAD
jgi:hypothetical protein